MSDKGSPKRKGTPIESPYDRKKRLSSSHDFLSPINTLDIARIPPSKSQNPLASTSLRAPNLPLKVNRLPQSYTRYTNNSSFTTAKASSFDQLVKRSPPPLFTTEKKALDSVIKGSFEISSESEDDEKAIIKETPADLDVKNNPTANSPEKSREFSFESAVQSFTMKSRQASLSSVLVSAFQYREHILPPSKTIHKYENFKLIFVQTDRILILSGMIDGVQERISIPFAKIYRIQFIRLLGGSSADWYIDFVFTYEFTLDLKIFRVPLGNREADAFQDCNTLRVMLARNCGLSSDSIENILLSIVRDRNAFNFSKVRDSYGEYEKTTVPSSPARSTPSRTSIKSNSGSQSSLMRFYSRDNLKSSAPSLEALSSSESVKFRTIQSPASKSPDIFTEFSPKRTSKRIKTPKSLLSSKSLQEISDDDDNEVISCSYVDPDFNNERVHLFTFPEGELNSVQVTSHELLRLEPGIWLNDTIIDFELKFMLAQMEREYQDKIHIFNSFFYKRLASAKLTLSDKEIESGKKTGFDLVKNWTKKVNIFEKDYIVVPINESFHWFVVVICNPSKMLIEEVEVDDKAREEEAKSSNETDDVLLSDDLPIVDLDDDPQPVESTNIFIFDSLGLTSRGKSTTIINRLRTYLQLEARDKLNKSTSKTACNGHVVRVPQQENYTDCGCFLLQFVEEFFKGIPTGIVNRISESSFNMTNWFPPALAQGRRVIMKKRVEELAKDFAERQKLKSATNPPAQPQEDRSSDIEEIIM